MYSKAVGGWWEVGRIEGWWCGGGGEVCWRFATKGGFAVKLLRFIYSLIFTIYFIFSII